MMKIRKKVYDLVKTAFDLVFFYLTQIALGKWGSGGALPSRVRVYLVNGGKGKD
jgi:hypothetical protein